MLTAHLKLPQLVPLLQGLSMHSHHIGLRRASVLLGASLCCATANAREARTTIGVNATVNAVARVEMHSVPGTVDITAADLHRGYLDVAEPISFIVRSNSPDGYALDLTTVVPIVTSIVVHGLDGDMALSAEGGTIVQRWQRRSMAAVSLQFRLVLAPGLGAGRYPWPVRLTARPL